MKKEADSRILKYGIIGLVIVVALVLIALYYNPPANNDGNALDITNCVERSEICTAQYDPVCGWWNSSSVQCIKYPCAATYSNGCYACADEKVVGYTAGEWPTG